MAYLLVAFPSHVVAYLCLHEVASYPGLVENPYPWEAASLSVEGEGIHWGFCAYL